MLAEVGYVDNGNISHNQLSLLPMSTVVVSSTVVFGEVVTALMRDGKWQRATVTVLLVATSIGRHNNGESTIIWCDDVSLRSSSVGGSGSGSVGGGGQCVGGDLGARTRQL